VFLKDNKYEHQNTVLPISFQKHTFFTKNFSSEYELSQEKIMNKKTKALTTEQYKEIIQTMKTGFSGCRPNERIATILVLEGNLGLRISDILNLRLCDIVRDGDRFRLEIVEQKTGKHRSFTVPLVIQQYIENYCLRNGIPRTATIFPVTERAVQKQLHIVCDYLGYDGISTHSFRKWYATEIYKNSGYDIALVQRLLQHSSAATTQRYIGIDPQRIEDAIQKHSQLL
jgi:integrase